jgi:hypothetical protein
MMDIASLISQLSQYGQEHLLHFWDSLQETERKELYKDIVELNLDEVTRFLETVKLMKTLRVRGSWMTDCNPFLQKFTELLFRRMPSV